jgi:hypothetical protein
MEEEEKSKGFKVQDRRRFSAEGELKPEHQGEETAAPEGPPSSPMTSGAKIVTGATDSTPDVASAGRREPGTGPLGEMTFASFMVGLSTQALMHLGEIADPQAGAPKVDLLAAQQLIDIVGMLQEKTRGNLDQHEQALVKEVLFELRMKYVERSSR